MVRPSYRANLAGDNGAAFFGMIFDPAGEGQSDPVDLRGGARAPRRFIDWETFFDFGAIARPSGTGTLGEDMRPNKLIDARIWAGLHYRHADVQGQLLGANVANYGAANYFQAVGR